MLSHYSSACHYSTLYMYLILMFSHKHTHLHEHSRSQVFVSVPPVAGAARTAAGAQDTLVQPVLQEEDRIFSVMRLSAPGKCIYKNES